MSYRHMDAALQSEGCVGQADSTLEYAGRVHMAAPAQRAVSGARRERNSNKHKRLFLPGEPGGLIVSPTPSMRSMPEICAVLQAEQYACEM